MRVKCFAQENSALANELHPYNTGCSVLYIKGWFSLATESES